MIRAYTRTKIPHAIIDYRYSCEDFLTFQEPAHNKFLKDSSELFSGIDRIDPGMEMTTYVQEQLEAVKENAQYF